VRVVTGAADPETALAAAEAVRGAVATPPLEALGPAPLFRVKDRHRSVVLVKADPRSRAVAVRVVGEAVDRAAQRFKGRASFAVDVDPQ
jgi:primosomal protein N'